MDFSNQNPWHILHIDDDEEDYMIARDMLMQSKGRKIQVDWSPTYEAGIEKLAQDHYHAVLVDYDLGLHTGIEIIRDYSHMYPAPLILYTGRGSSEVDLEAMQAGATLYITKNEVNPLLLERAIRYAIELKQRENELRKSKEDLYIRSRLVELSYEPVTVWSLEDGIQIWNEGCERLYGYTPEEAIGRVTHDLLHTQHPIPLETFLRELHTKKHWTGELSHRTKGGREVIVESRQELLEIDGKQMVLETNHDITERKQSEAALRLSEQKYAKTFNSNPAAIAISTVAEGRFLEVNDRYCALYGFTREELVGHTSRELGLFPNPEDRQEIVRRFHASGGFADYEIQLRTKSGELKDVIFSTEGIEINDQQCMVSMVLDITERKQAEYALRLSQEKLQSVLDSTHDIVFSLDHDWRFVYVNQNFCNTYQLSLSDVEHKVFWEVFPRYLGTPVETYYRQVIEQKTAAHFQLGGLYSDAWYGISVYPTNDGVTVFATNQTEQQQAELAKQESERRFQVLFDYSPDAVFLTRPDGSVEAANQAACLMFGWSEQEIRELGRSGLLDATDPRVAVNLSERERIGRLQNREQTAIRKDGTRFPVEVSSVILPGDPIRSFVVLRDITERKRAEAALKAERDTLEAVVRNLNSGVMIADAQGKLLSMNPAALRMHDFDSLDEMFSTPEQFNSGFEMYTLDGQLLSMEERPAHRAMRGDFFSNLEYRVRNLNKGREWIGVWNVAPVRGSQGEIQLLVFTVRDITEQYRYEDTLRESEARLRAHNRELETVLETVPAYMFITHDPLAREMSGNKATLDLMRMQPEENLSKTGPESEKLRHFKAVRDGQEIPNEELPVQKVAAAGVPLENYEFDIVFEDGEIRHLLGNVSPLLDENGKPAGAVSAFIDITKRKQIEAKLRESESRFRVALASAPISIYTTDCDLRITWMYAPYPGFQPESVAGKRLDALVPPEIGTQLIAIQQSVIDAGESRRGEVMGWVEEKAAWYAYYMDPIRDESGKVTGLACAGYDITDRKQAESDLQRYAEELERSNQALQDFAFIASHDLQEPLRKVTAFGHMLEMRFSSEIGPEGEDYIHRITSASSRMAEMLSGLLAYSRVTTQGEAFREVNLQKVAQEVLSDLEVRIRETGGNVELGSMPVIHADPLQMRQLLQNLIGNALKYHRPGLPPQVRISSRKPEKGSLEIIVEDNGIGFDMKDAANIFQPFVRLHGRSEYEGTGMGLAICQKIVERHNGSIHVESEPGVGSTFTVSLPTNR